jgi:hypothetical protein
VRYAKPSPKSNAPFGDGYVSQYPPKDSPSNAANPFKWKQLIAVVRHAAPNSYSVKERTLNDKLSGSAT